MPFVISAPELMTSAASDLATIGSNLGAANTAAAVRTAAVIPAAADEVSASIAHLFSGYAQDYQKLAGEAAAFHAQFVQRLRTSAGAYASAEATNVTSLQPLTASAGSVGPPTSIGAFQDWVVSWVTVAVRLLSDPVGLIISPVLGAIAGLILLPFVPLLSVFLFFSSPGGEIA